MIKKLNKIKGFALIWLLITTLLLIPINLATYSLTGEWVLAGDKIFYGIVSVGMLFAIDYIYFKLKPLIEDELEELGTEE